MHSLQRTDQENDENRRHTLVAPGKGDVFAAFMNMQAASHDDEVDEDCGEKADEDLTIVDEAQKSKAVEEVKAKKTSKTQLSKKVT